MKYEKSCGAVIFDGDKILVLQQAEGHWGFPKGHVENNETEIETAIREIKEETNLDIEINEKFRYSEKYFPTKGIEKEVVYFIAKKVGGIIKPQEEEVQKIEWYNFENAIKRLTFKNSRKILRKAWNDYISYWK